MNRGAEEHRRDFTEAHYRELLGLAKSQYDFVFYDAPDLTGRVVLWRHDLDYSVHRGLQLARIEAEEGVRATYFIHMHSPLYHWGEKDVADRLREIAKLGHQLALHFDPGFYLGRMQDEPDLVKWLAWEKQMLETELGQQIRAFSFHNPDVGGNWLRFNSDRLGGMLNAYGRSIVENFTYCSDSNGYWRFKRLADVLAAAEAPRLQVLTHPEWWQQDSMYPRERIHRAIHGRALKALFQYDELLDSAGRVNLHGKSQALLFLKKLDSSKFSLLDALWNQSQFQALLPELYRLSEEQILRICRRALEKEWNIPEQKLAAFFEDGIPSTQMEALFHGIFGENLGLVDFGKRSDKKRICENLLGGASRVSWEELESVCVDLCEGMARLAEWGLLQPGLEYSGIGEKSVAGDGGLKDLPGAGPETKKWDELLKRLGKYDLI